MYSTDLNGSLVSKNWTRGMLTRIFVLAAICGVFAVSATAQDSSPQISTNPAASSASSGNSSAPVAILEASIRAMDKAMMATDASQTLPKTAAAVSRSEQGQAQYSYDRYRIEQFRAWAAKHSPDYSRIAAWSTFDVKSVKITGGNAAVTLFETLHIDSTIRDDGTTPHFSAAKQNEQALLKKEGRIIGVGQVIHTTAGILHNVDLTKTADGWKIDQDLYWDPLVQSLAADHKTSLIGSPSAVSQSVAQASRDLSGSQGTSSVASSSAANQSSAANKPVAQMPSDLSGSQGTFAPSGSGRQMMRGPSPQVAANFSYNRQGAVRYADQWWKTINPAYPSYMSIGEDCANFVSQCMHDATGGQIPTDTRWYINSYDWINADGLYNHFVANYSSGNYATTSYAAANSWQKANFYPGDIEFFHWTDSGSAPGIKDHTAICVALDANGNSLLDCHTTNTYHALWDLGWSSHTADWYFVLISAPISGSYSDNANFVADVTIPDGTVLAPGQTFTKTWSMKDTGTTTWGPTYQWVFDSGSQMGGSSPGSVPALTAGQTGNISVSLTAPSSPGAYTGYWRMLGPHGKFGDEVSVKIVVSNPAISPPSVTFDTTHQNKWYGPSDLNTHIASWTLNDTGGGIGGFSQNWDSSPSGASPASPGAKTGFLTFGDIADGQRQGKHTAYVRAWSADLSHGQTASSAWYGYDALPPTVVVTSGQPDSTAYNTPQHITFHVADPDSGAAGWGAAWDSDPSRQSVVADGSLDLPVGTHTLNVHVWDNVGNERDYTFGPFTYNVAAPQAGWTAKSIAAGADGKTRLLWTKTDGTTSFWTVDSVGRIAYSSVYGPYTGWTASKVAAGPNGATELFWTNSNGSASYWTVSPSGAVTYSPTYGPYSGWTPTDFSAGVDGTARLLWDNTAGASWFSSISAAGAAASSPVYGPYSGWNAIHIAAGPSGNTRLLWTGASGTASFWSLDSFSAITYSPCYGPYAGWSCADLGVATDGKTRLQWNNGGATSFWTLDSAGRISYSPVWGPYAGWSPTDFAVAPDGTIRLLWDNVNGAASFWTVGFDNGVNSSPAYGPF